MTHDDIRRVLLDTVTAEDIRQMARALADKARAGDVAACELLWSYTIGPPLDAVISLAPSREDERSGDAPKGELLNLPQMAHRLGVPQSWLRAHVEAGRVPALRVNRCRWRCEPGAVTAALARLAAEGETSYAARHEMKQALAETGLTLHGVDKPSST